MCVNGKGLKITAANGVVSLDCHQSERDSKKISEGACVHRGVLKVYTDVWCKYKVCVHGLDWVVGGGGVLQALW